MSEQIIFSMHRKPDGTYPPFTLTASSPIERSWLLTYPDNPISQAIISAFSCQSCRVYKQATQKPPSESARPGIMPYLNAFPNQDNDNQVDYFFHCPQADYYRKGKAVRCMTPTTITISKP